MQKFCINSDSYVSLLRQWAKSNGYTKLVRWENLSRCYISFSTHSTTFASGSKHSFTVIQGYLFYGFHHVSDHNTLLSCIYFRASQLGVFSRFEGLKSQFKVLGINHVLGFRLHFKVLRYILRFFNSLQENCRYKI